MILCYVAMAVLESKLLNERPIQALDMMGYSLVTVLCDYSVGFVYLC